MSPRHTSSAVSPPQVTDTTSGLSYQRLSSPWQQGCPSDLNTPMFDWSAGENTVAGPVSIGGSLIDWHGLACSGQLQPQFAYAGPADLEPTAMSLLSALDPAYYAGVPHSRTIEDSSAMQVSGHQGWIVRFLMTYPDGASQGLTWSSEPGAVVVVDRGENQAPAVFYVSVPASLGTRTPPRSSTRFASASVRLAFRDADVAAAAVHRDRVGGGRADRNRRAVVAAVGGLEMA